MRGNRAVAREEEMKVSKEEVLHVLLLYLEFQNEKIAKPLKLNKPDIGSSLGLGGGGGPGKVGVCENKCMSFFLSYLVS
jgi:hypothetical protein